MKKLLTVFFGMFLSIVLISHAQDTAKSNPIYQQLENKSQQQQEKANLVAQQKIDSIGEAGKKIPEQPKPMIMKKPSVKQGEIRVTASDIQDLQLKAGGEKRTVTLQGENLNNVYGTLVLFQNKSVREIETELGQTTAKSLVVILKAKTTAEDQCCYMLQLLASDSSITVSDKLLKIKVKKQPLPSPPLVPLNEGTSSQPAPNAPTNLVRQRIQNSLGVLMGIKLTWTDNSNIEEGFKIEKGYAATGQFNQIATVGSNQTSYLDNTPNDRGYYRVKAFNQGGDSNYAGTSFPAGAGFVGSPRNTPPLAVLISPSNLEARPVEKSSTGIRLTWTDNSNGEEGFKILRNTNSALAFDQIATVGANETSYTDENLNPCTTYYYRVNAYNSSFESGHASGIASTAPSPPTGVVASQGTQVEMIFLDWNVVACADRYRVYELSSENGNYIYLGETPSITVQSPNNLADIVGVTPNKYIFYKISSVDASGNEGGMSEHAVGWAAANLMPPANVRASQGTYSDIIRLQWDPAANATRYKVYWSSAFSGQYTFLGDAAGTSTDIGSATPNTRYYFRVSSLDVTNAESGLSNVAEGWRGTNTYSYLPAPTGVQASDGTYTDRIQVSWNSVNGARSYNLYRSSDSFFIAPIRIANTTSTSYTDMTNIYPGAGYFYKVTAVDTQGVEGYLSGYDGGYAIRPVPFP